MSHPPPPSDPVPGLAPTVAAREECHVCRRPVGLCVCDAITAVEHAVPVTIVQHPRERGHAFGTARLARRALRHVDVQVAWPTPDGLRVALDLPPGAALLYPSAQATLLEPGPTRLVVLDGTWALVRQLLRDNPALAALPHVRLAPQQPGNYRIRREPAAHCLSTVESIVAALRVLEPGNEALAGALTGFDTLIDRQLSHLATLDGRGRLRRRSTGREGNLQLLARQRDHVVVVYAEVLHGSAPHLLHWGARRLTGETCEFFVRPAVVPRPELLARMGLPPELDGTLAEGLARWAAFSRPDDVVVAWSDQALGLFAQTTGLSPRTVDLKSTWCNRHRETSGTLPELITRLGLTPPVVALSGRAGARVGNATAVLEHLLAGVPAAAT